MGARLDAFTHVLSTGFMFVYFGIGGALLSWVILPIARLSKRKAADKRRVSHRLVVFGYRQFHRYMRSLRLLDFDPSSVPATLPDRPCVIVANHPTLVDITAVLSVYRDACTVVRGTIFGLPFFGPSLRYLGYIDAGGGASMAGAAVIQAAIDRLREGLHVVIFPEGTRSEPGSLHRFRRGAFEVALRADVPVVPLFITCDPPTLMKGVRWYALPKRLARLRIEPLAPIFPARFEGDSVRFAQHVESLLQEKVEAWLAGRAADPSPLPTLP